MNKLTKETALGRMAGGGGGSWKEGDTTGKKVEK